MFRYIDQIVRIAMVKNGYIGHKANGLKSQNIVKTCFQQKMKQTNIHTTNFTLDVYTELCSFILFWLGGWVSKIVENKFNSTQALAMKGTALSNIQDQILEQKYSTLLQLFASDDIKQHQF